MKAVAETQAEPMNTRALDADTAAGWTAPVPPEAVLALRPLTIVGDGEEFLVGDPARSHYVLLPEVAVTIIRLLQVGNSVAAAAAAIGPEVDVADFAATLIALGFAAQQAGDASVEPAPAAGRRVPPWIVRPLFSRAAWTVYAGCAALVAAIFAVRPALLPRPEDPYFLSSPLVSIACVVLLTYVLSGVHELWHWAAARAEGLDAGITISRRLYFLAFETDLTQLWSLPRRRRYGALLAGMAFDSMVLSSALVARLGVREGWWQIGQHATGLLGAVVFIELAALVAQCYVFMRTDLYAVMVTATGCVNLWRVNQLRLLGVVRRLRPEQQRELAEAHPRDLVVARWYVVVYLAGLGLAMAFFAVLFVPALAHLVGWLVQTVGAARVTTPAFWTALLFAVIVFSPHVITAALALRDLRRRLQRRRGRASATF
jgi:hypothetical protein